MIVAFRLIAAMVLLTAAAAVLGCQQTQLTTTTTSTSEVYYGPRWADYRAWGRLELGLSKATTIDILGEPFLPALGVAQPAGNSETLVFKIRPKHYKVRETALVTVMGTAPNTTAKAVKERDIYPEKAAEVVTWGDLVDLHCVFVNGRLTRWYVPGEGDSVARTAPVVVPVEMTAKK